MLMAATKTACMAVAVLCGLNLVNEQHRLRLLHARIERERMQQERLDEQLRQLETERRALITIERVQTVAQQKLGMQPATPGTTLYVTEDGTPAGSRP